MTMQQCVYDIVAYDNASMWYIYIVFDNVTILCIDWNVHWGTWYMQQCGVMQMQMQYTTLTNFIRKYLVMCKVCTLV